jgi:hypothetical protein
VRRQRRDALDAEDGHVPKYQHVGAFQYPSGFPMRRAWRWALRWCSSWLCWSPAVLRTMLNSSSCSSSRSQTACSPTRPSCHCHHRMLPEPEVKWERLVEVLGAWAVSCAMLMVLVHDVMIVSYTLFFPLMKN